MAQNTVIAIRETSKLALDKSSIAHDISRVQLVSMLLVGFALLPKDERTALLHIGKQGLNMLEIGAILEIDKPLKLSEELKAMFDE